jgi:hypothetical protein
VRFRPREAVTDREQAGRDKAQCLAARECAPFGAQLIARAYFD